MGGQESQLDQAKGVEKSRNRDFVEEVANILNILGCTAYAASIDKRNLIHEMKISTTMPMQLQALVEHFALECLANSETGLLISDWSRHDLDAHASNCVGSFVVTRHLPLHPSVYYANSSSSHAIQVADLVSGIRRRALEGDVYLSAADRRLESIRAFSPDNQALTVTGRPFRNWIDLI